MSVGTVLSPLLPKQFGERLGLHRRVMKAKKSTSLMISGPTGPFRFSFHPPPKKLCLKGSYPPSSYRKQTEQVLAECWSKMLSWGKTLALYHALFEYASCQLLKSS